MSSINEFIDQYSLYEFEQKTSFTGDSSPITSNEENWLTLRHILKEKRFKRTIFKLIGYERGNQIS